MATKPTTAQIRDRAERRMHELGDPKPQEGEPSYETKRRIWDERFAKQLTDSELFLTHAYEIDQRREDDQ
ncbi:MAG: hypothetical protein H0T72_12980, partial [Chloroflexia bacterium]|nr:hypothetical protein [Chloroflexia bacterium]